MGVHHNLDQISESVVYYFSGCLFSELYHHNAPATGGPTAQSNNYKPSMVLVDIPTKWHECDRLLYQVYGLDVAQCALL